MAQLLEDQAELRQREAEAEAKSNYVEAFFCSTLLHVISEHVPPDAVPSSAPVVLTPAAVVDDVPLDAKEVFIDSVPQLVASLVDALTPVNVANKADGAADTDSASPPRKSRQELERLRKAKHRQLIGALDEMLAVSSAMPEVDLPLSQADVVATLAHADAVPPLVACVDVKQSGEARLRAAGALCMLVIACYPCSSSMAMSDGRSRACRAIGAYGRSSAGGRRGVRAEWRRAGMHQGVDLS